MRFLLEGAVSDGGQWNMLVSLVEKYGVCPKDAYPESFQAGHTRKLNSLMNRRLRKFALEAKAAFDVGNKEVIDKLQQETLKEVYQLLATNFGLPPKEFVFEYYDEDHKAHAKELTPSLTAPSNRKRIFSASKSVASSFLTHSINQFAFSNLS